jgi:predicted NUDIX family NTP pyrophosphohydrolase
MGTQLSAGILMFRRDRGEIEVLIAHPGGPFWARKDTGAWSVPKGLVEPGEDPQETAIREFREETGSDPGAEALLSLGSVTLRSGKQVVVWAVSGTVDPDQAVSNLVHMEWPRGSGRWIDFPEVDRLLWCSISEAEWRLNPAQGAFLARLIKTLDRVE